ncbi:MAG: HelD family protein, partial [Acidimicrobiales bacterium]
LCFGRIDTARPGGAAETWYIGRRHVEDGAGDPVVVEWRAPVAVPFYRARPNDPMGLVRRRQFLVDGRQVVSLADDRFGEGAGSDGDPRLRGGDALLAELERSRAGEMLDIVATIQVEQDEVIRSPLPGVLAVQGGPGTGKTAIGLHRAAYLLYAHPELARSSVLVVGPNRTFLRYISMVLPSLGEEAVLQTTLADLVPGVRAPGPEAPGAELVKGDVRMAAVLVQALAGRRGTVEEDVVLSYRLTRLVLAAADVNAAAGALASRQAPYQAGRAALRDRLVSMAYRRAVQEPALLGSVEPAGVARALRADPGFRAALDRLWPAVSAKSLVRDLLDSPVRLARAAAGVLTPDEQAALLGRDGAAGAAGAAAEAAAATRRARSWTVADIPLLDEAEALLGGVGRTYGHVVVDEAQDLSPMQLRMLARRCPAGSMTVLGDLAQGTGAFAHDSWDEVVEHLPTPEGHRLEELTLGYRAPGQVLDLASRLLAVAAPGIVPTESVRRGRQSPLIVRTGPTGLLPEAAAQAAGLGRSYGSVGVVTAAAAVRGASRALAAAGVDYGVAERDGLARPVTVLAAVEARGLELDAVVVVEPAAILADAPRGLRLLYVCLTRPVQALSIVHAAPLPDALVG